MLKMHLSASRLRKVLSVSKPDRPIKNNPVPKIDPAAYRQRIDRVTEIFSNIAGRAEDLSKFRCPYRDRLDRCTGKFRCRNQVSPPSENMTTCSHGGRFDYRSAWETKPEFYGRAKTKIKKIKRLSAKKRASLNAFPKKD